MPSSNSAVSQDGEPGWRTLAGPPDRMMPFGLRAARSAAVVSNFRISQ